MTAYAINNTKKGEQVLHAEKQDIWVLIADYW